MTKLIWKREAPSSVNNFDLVVENPGDVDPQKLEQLLNEVLKEHKKVEAQQTNITQLNSKMASQAAIIAKQQEGMEALTAQLKEQATQIQKVSAQLEVSKQAPQVVNYEK